MFHSNSSQFSSVQVASSSGLVLQPHMFRVAVWFLNISKPRTVSKAQWVRSSNQGESYHCCWCYTVSLDGRTIHHEASNEIWRQEGQFNKMIPLSGRVFPVLKRQLAILYCSSAMKHLGSWHRSPSFLSLYGICSLFMDETAWMHRGTPYFLTCMHTRAQSQGFSRFVNLLLNLWPQPTQRNYLQARERFDLQVNYHPH